MKSVPLLLILFRLGIALVLPLLALLRLPDYGPVAAGLCTAGLLSDVFDGIIARKLGVSTTGLRRLDSFVDQLFWLSVAGAAWIHCPAFFAAHAGSLSLLLGAEALAYAVSYLRFGREVATHALSSKLWSLVLFATLLQLTLTCDSGALYQVCLYLGIATRLEIVAILLLLPRWITDVPSVYHAVRLRKGKTIRRHKLFNG